jgi:hypothetical protein
MVPHDFSLLPQFKNTLKGKQFENVEMIKLNAILQLLDIPEQSKRSSSSGRTNGIHAAKQEVHNSKRISPLKMRFSIVSFSVNLDTSSLGLTHLHTHTHTHTQSIKLPGTANHAAM